MDPQSTTGLLRDARRTTRRARSASTDAPIAARSLSIVIPAHGDAPRLRAMLPRLSSWIERAGRIADVIVVNADGDRAVADVALGFAASFHRVRTLKSDARGGRGAAIRMGVAAAQEPAVLVIGTDLPTPFEDAEALLAALDNGADVAVGSRVMRGATILREEPLRVRVFNGLLRFLASDLVPCRVEDLNPSAIALRVPRVRPILHGCRIDGHAWAVELYSLARCAKLEIAEVAIRHTGDRRPRFAFWSATFEMMRDLARLAARLRARAAAAGIGGS